MEREQIKNTIARSTPKSATIGQIRIRLNLLQKAASRPADLQAAQLI
jgi:hypothetical protein